MTEKTKITLSASELELVRNKEWILTKHIIIEKVYSLFGELALSMQQHIDAHAQGLPPEVIISSPKISRGENYRLLPYVMLDYPRHFTKDAVLAIRTLFWWGNFFSINLHLSGSFKDKATSALNKDFVSMQQNDYWICVHTDPWEHHFEENNYLPLRNYTAADFAAILKREQFVKLAKRISLNEWESAEKFLSQHFIGLITMLESNFPGDEKDLLPGIPIIGSDP